MRYAIVSDLHANAQAWNAVLTDIGSNDVDRILCLGDLVGYGPDPVKVMESVHRHVHAIVLGNHDAVVCGKMSPDTFNERARQVILWTQNQVGKRACDFLGALPLTLTAPGFRCAHGSFANPAAFDYVLEPDDATASWQAVPEPLLFVGHSHTPGIFVLGRSGTPHRIEPQDFSVEAGKRYIVNVGSVGSPRDGDARACYVIFDAATGNVVFRRIPFDLDAFREAVVRAKLNPEDVPSLRRDPRLKLASVREQLDFAPATTREHEAQGVAEVGDVARSLRRSAARWRFAAAAAVLLAVVGTVAAFAVARRDRPEPLAVPTDPLEAVTTLVPSAAGGSFLPDLPEGVGADGGARPWRMVYGDRRHQAAVVASGAPAQFALRSADAQTPLRLEAPAVRLADGDAKFVLHGEARRSDGFEGHVAVVVDILRTTVGGGEEWVPNYETVEFRQVRGSEGWETAQKTKEFPKATRQVRVAVVGNFNGEVALRGLRLTRAQQ
jgi:diadenosine tetraphosphatase ApaH/serine/threonine PP2A family protein phosphatase